jgi:proteasome assembly chaperone (PAC2) family protein
MPRHVRLAAMLVLVAAIAPAQTKNTDWNTVKALATGANVRITTSSRTVGGSVLRVTDDSLVLAAGKSQEMFTQQEVKRVLLRGDSHRGRNSLIGLGGGAAIGLIIGAATHKDCTGFCILYTSRGTDMAAGAAVVGGIGAAVGALIPTRSWLEIYRQ